MSALPVPDEFVPCSLREREKIAALREFTGTDDVAYRAMLARVIGRAAEGELSADEAGAIVNELLGKVRL